MPLLSNSTRHTVEKEVRPVLKTLRPDIDNAMNGKATEEYNKDK